MPRRRQPVKVITELTCNPAESAALRAQIIAIVRKEPQLKRLSGTACTELIDRLFNAVCYAQAGVRDILSGKKVKPDAWGADILVRDVCDALRSVGVPPVMASERALSLAQHLAGQIGTLSGSSMKGELSHQMHRARLIKKEGGRCPPRKPVLVLGRWQISDLVRSLFVPCRRSSSANQPS
jgi:hypothetical protein